MTRSELNDKISAFSDHPEIIMGYVDRYVKESLPSDEEIERELHDGKIIQGSREEYMIDGAKWIIDKILNK